MSEKLNILIDSRESNLYNDIIDRDLDIYTDKIEFNKNNIDIGDINIKYRDIEYIFERKTINDLISSIHDGRYREQKARMIDNYDNKRITYIIEGDDILSSKTYNKSKVLQSTYLNILFRDNIRLIFTKNVNETATLILSLSIKIIENPENFNNISNNNTTYTDHLKLKKKKIENIDEKTCYLMQLSQIPYISNTIAKNISNIYPSMTSLILALNEVDDKNKELCKIEGVGKEKASYIIKYLFNK
jgi:ERCC4-type nuclease